MFQDARGRKRCKLKAVLSKRGRKRGVFGFLRGRPWASRTFELTSTYTSSTLKYYKEDKCRGSFDLLGSTVQSVPASSADGRNHAFELRLSSRERFIMCADNAADATKWIQALEQSGVVPTANDRLAEQMSIELLGDDREAIAYRFLGAKTLRDEVRRNTHAEIDPPALVALEAQLEADFPRICMGDKDSRAEEELARQEYEREIDTHLAEATASKRAFEPEASVDAKYNEKVAESRARYVLAKEARFLQYILQLVEKYR